MPLTLTEKIIYAHLAGKKKARGETTAIRVDQTLTQDATGTMAYLQFERMQKDRVQTECSVSYIDHNTLQEDFKNMDDHRYLQSAAARYGVFFSRAGNGICHQVHLEKFGVPGKTLLGSDSHTPTAGGLGMLAIGAGGLDVAVAMAGGAFSLPMPRVFNVALTGRLQNGAAAKDIILELLRRETVQGGVGAVYEYSGGALAGLSVTERATIANMGAELGATSSLFPSDERTREFLAVRGRESCWTPLAADDGALYDKTIAIDLEALRPLAACPHSPGSVRPVRELEGMPVDQVVIGSCTNSSLDDLAAVARIVEGRTVHPRVSAGIACGSRTVLLAAAEAGILARLIRAGFRVLENACGPCIGMGFAPASGGVSLRTFNRNFKGRSGTADANVYLVSPQTAAASAIQGVFSAAAAPSPAGIDAGAALRSVMPYSDDLIIPPLSIEESRRVSLERGPNIKPCPDLEPPSDSACLPVLLKAGDNISTDDIMPAGAKVLPLRSNIPEIAKHTFSPIDKDFYARAKAAGGGIIVAGQNYGQGSSREHAALAPAYLGVKAVIVQGYARIHKANLINYGIVPLIFEDSAAYTRIQEGDEVSYSGLRRLLESEEAALPLCNKRTGERFLARLEVSAEERAVLRAGGRIAYMKGAVS